MATNIWARFKRLLPDSPLIIVTVNSINLVAGTSMVTTVGGGGMKVLGTAVAVGKMAYVKDGAIIGEAPNLQHYEIGV
ncbi:MAG: hypothetical protein F9K32_16530 [Desulfobulbaceae bacterium]|nr:MAG: hypothetical protein F9K32_16530 [Desulfobulbaceae bacterium]